MIPGEAARLGVGQAGMRLKIKNTRLLQIAGRTVFPDQKLSEDLHVFGRQVINRNIKACDRRRLSGSRRESVDMQMINRHALRASAEHLL